MTIIDHSKMRWLLLLALVLLLNACSDDAPGNRKKERVQLELRPCASSYIEDLDTTLTRGVWTPPSPYVLYTDINDMFANQKNLTNKSIHVFFTKDGADAEEGTFFYKEFSNEWRMDLDVAADDYYLYGFIPKEDATSATIVPNVSYSNGAVLTINGLNTVTPSDVCVLIGAKDNNASDDDGGLLPGKFLTTINSGSNDNFIYLLFDHIYAALRFRFKVDEDYAALRTIRLRKLELIAYKDGSQGSVSAKFDAVIKLKANATGASPIEEVTFTPVTTSASVPPVPIFEWDGTDANEVTLRKDAFTDFMGCFVPGDNTYFKLRSTYDVYDKNLNYEKEANGEYKKDEHGNLIPIVDKYGLPVGNLIRKGSQAENTIDLRKMFGNELTTTRGHRYSLTMTVQPTYLYMLSDPDLDNPTVKVN